MPDPEDDPNRELLFLVKNLRNIETADAWERNVEIVLSKLTTMLTGQDAESNRTVRRSRGGYLR